MLLDSGRWAVVTPDRAPYEITSGEVFAVDVAGVMTVTRMEFSRGPAGGRYVSVDDYRLAEGLRVAVGTDIHVTADEIAGMDWWNAMTDDERRRTFDQLVALGRPVIVAEAWAIEKRNRAARR